MSGDPDVTRRGHRPVTGHPHVRAGGRLPRVGSGDPHVAWTGLRRHGFRRRGRRRGWGLDARRRQVASPQDQERHRERSQRGSSRHRPFLRSLLARALSLPRESSPTIDRAAAGDGGARRTPAPGSGAPSFTASGEQGTCHGGPPRGPRARRVTSRIISRNATGPNATLSSARPRVVWSSRAKLSAPWD